MQSHGLGAMISLPRDPGHGVMGQHSPSLVGAILLHNQIMLEIMKTVLQPIGGMLGSGMI